MNLTSKPWWRMAAAHGWLASLAAESLMHTIHGYGRPGGFKSERAYRAAKARRKMQAASRKANR